MSYASTTPWKRSVKTSACTSTFYIRNWSHITTVSFLLFFLLFLLGQPLQKQPKVHCFQSDRGEILQDHCFSRYALIDGVRLSIVSLVISRLDYGNAVLIGLPVYLVCRLQSVLNAAARLIYHMRSADHITDALISLHWLRASQRIEYKVAVLTYKVLHGSAPWYLGPLVPVADLQGRRTLRSAGTNRLVVPSIRLSTVGSRTFSVAAPRV